MKKGYKQSEIGVIPEDWDIHSLEDEIEKLVAGVSVNSINEDMEIAGHDQVILKTSAVYNGVFHPEESKKIVPKDIHRARLNPINDTIIVSRMNTPELVGECGYVAKTYETHYLPDRLWMTQFKKSSQVNVKWLSYILSYSEFKKHIKEIATGTSGSMKNISKEALLEVRIPFPTKAEQTAIATALSDTDALIQSLEKLISKKRLIKQGAMQELLKPKEGWAVKKLGTDCELITKGTTPTSIGENFQSSGISFIKIESLGEDGNILMDKVAFIDRKTNNLLMRSQLKVNDVLISIAGALGRVAIVKKDILPANTNQALAIVRLKSEAMLELPYLFHFLKSNRIQKHIEAISVQGAQANLSLENINDLPIDKPSTKAKQVRIAEILSDMDTEIFALETKLAKYKQIKQGMMQNLLIGMIRMI